MRVRDTNWMQIEALLRAGEDRAVLPLGSIEQHAYLSLAVDATLAEQIATRRTPALIAPFALERFYTDTLVSELAAAAVSH